MSLDTAAADRVTAAVFFALGAAMARGGFVMDRLEVRQIDPASIPGLLPMILGAALMICAALLFLGARRRVSEPAAEGGAAAAPSWGALAFAAGWSVFYALVLVGRVPFAAATAVYIAVFVLWFRDGTGALGVRGVASVIVLAFIAAAGIAALFRYGFLVRLP